MRLRYTPIESLEKINEVCEALIKANRGLSVEELKGYHKAIGIIIKRLRK